MTKAFEPINETEILQRNTRIAVLECLRDLARMCSKGHEPKQASGIVHQFSHNDAKTTVTLAYQFNTPNPRKHTNYLSMGINSEGGLTEYAMAGIQEELTAVLQKTKVVFENSDTGNGFAIKEKPGVHQWSAIIDECAHRMEAINNLPEKAEIPRSHIGNLGSLGHHNPFGSSHKTLEK